MKAKLYKGLSNDKKYYKYFIIRNMDYDISKELDERGKPHKFIKNIDIIGEIKSWNPFMAEYKDYSGKQIIKVFICPICNSANCERTNQKEYSDPHFFQGNFICSNCGAGEFNYYSDCFHKKVEKRQLSLNLF